MLFPDLSSAEAMRINLNDEAVRWQGENVAAARNPLLDPAECSRMIAAAHLREGVDWSYGGYLESRRHLWRGSYLEKTGNFLHLGVDFNVPQGTEVLAGFSAGVVVVDNDFDRDGGWGERVILRPEGAGSDVFLIYAHLQRARVKPGDHISAGAMLAEVGGPPDNGNWHPHLHVQAVRAPYFESILLDNFDALDGYGNTSEAEALERYFPNPLLFLGRI